MRPKTKIEVPNPDPKASEFESFDRFMRTLISKRPRKPSAKELGKDQERERKRLPRP